MHAGACCRPSTGALAVIPWYGRGAAGWAVLAAGIVAWDLLAPETLSASFRKAHDHPASAAAVTVAWALLTAHLWNVLPQAADPLHVIHAARDRRRGCRCAVLVA